MQNRAVSFYSEGAKPHGDLFVPDGLAASERRPGIVLTDRQSTELAAAARAGGLKRLVALRRFGHYEVYYSDAFRQMMEHAPGWYRRYSPIGQHGGAKS